ncbi:small multidrug resistance protein [Candidatus Koribacter versatilis Ellin345]|uniref:Small multidrug resistance protein n=1 Tax=Koribacter versatilis (strain Ellin345) TaxID=204669 RepID=Q1IH96_KORVE|nr:multidrug efflux SMR transporter [Candidatus Koribacter versatilis]ABF43754.1 small multidrug resistance protein [Candidatus Koribacter versatilis Ellin345]
MCWLWLFLAIALEVAATILMKYSDGFTRFGPTVGMLVLYALSLAPLARVLKELEVGAVYAIWSALGTVAVALLGMVLFHEPANALKVFSIVLIIVGVVGLNLSGRSSKNEIEAHNKADIRLAATAVTPVVKASNHR